MADTQTKLPIAALGTREVVIKIKATVVVTAGAATVSETDVVFDKAFVNIPEVIGVVCVDEAVVKGTVHVHSVTKLGLTAGIYQVLEADVASESYEVEVTLVGWKVS